MKLKNKISKNRSNIIFTSVIILVIIILYLLPSPFEKHNNSSLRVKAVVLETDNESITARGLIRVGTQFVKIRIANSKFEGEYLDVKNVLTGQMSYDVLYRKGDVVFTCLSLMNNNTQIKNGVLKDIYRINYEWILFLIFAAILVGFAGWIGLKALISFIFTAMCMWKVLIPLFLMDYSPIIVSVLFVVLCTFVIIPLVTGFSRKCFVALSGASLGMIVTAFMAVFFSSIFRIPGTVKEFSETLLYSGFTHLNITDIFISGIFIAAAGAVMDVAMDISAAQNEIISHKKNIGRKALIYSGFRVAYPVLGPMTTTLLFAYSGSFLFVFMVFMAKGTPLPLIMNTNFIAAEILHTIVGSLGLVLVAPFTAIVGGFVFSKS